MIRSEDVAPKLNQLAASAELRAWMGQVIAPARLRSGRPVQLTQADVAGAICGMKAVGPVLVLHLRANIHCDCQSKDGEAVMTEADAPREQ